jgi:hypothetical protein
MERQITLISLCFVGLNFAHADSECSINGDILNDGGFKIPQVSFTEKDNSCSKYKEVPEFSTVIDLNNDGSCEYITLVPEAGGTGGHYYDISGYMDGKDFPLGGLRAWDITPLERKDGWYQFLSTDHSGGEYFVTIYSNVDGEYRPIKTKVYKCDDSKAVWELTEHR